MITKANIAAIADSALLFTESYSSYLLGSVTNEAVPLTVPAARRLRVTPREGREALR